MKDVHGLAMSGAMCIFTSCIFAGWPHHTWGQPTCRIFKAAEGATLKVGHRLIHWERVQQVEGGGIPQDAHRGAIAEAPLGIH